MTAFHLWQETSKKLLESCNTSVSTTTSNQCPWLYLTELRPSWQAGSVLADPSCHRQWAGTVLAEGPGTINLCWGSTPVSVSSKQNSYSSSLAQPSVQPCHTAATVGTTPEVIVNSGEFVLVASCCDFPVIPKEVKSVQAQSDLLTSRPVDTQFARRSTFL